MLTPKHTIWDESQMHVKVKKNIKKNNNKFSDIIALNKIILCCHEKFKHK
jgi:hypothetical protein